MNKLAGILIAASLAAGFAGAASAQPRHDEGRHNWDGWRDRDIHRFHDHDFEVWRTGRWFQGRHAGRVGWWWVLGDAWYYYPQPVYPYPDPYIPPVAVPPPPPGPSRQVFYYCPRPRGYYPYVQACPAPWRAVPG